MKRAGITALWVLAAGPLFGQNPCSFLDPIVSGGTSSGAGGLFSIYVDARQDANGAPCPIEVLSDSSWLHLLSFQKSVSSYYLANVELLSNTQTSPRWSFFLVNGRSVGAIFQDGSNVSLPVRRVTALYQSILFREPDAPGLSFWSGPGAPLNPDGTVGLGTMTDLFMTSPEFLGSGWRAMAVWYATNGLVPTFAQWLNALPTAANPADPAIEATIASAAFKVNSNPLWVLLLYYAILGRDADVGGVAYWLGVANTTGGPGVFFDSSPVARSTRIAILGTHAGQGFVGAPEFTQRFQ